MAEECPPAYATQPDPGREHRLERMAKLAWAIGRPLIPWQAYALRVITEIAEDGLPAYRFFVITIPRQGGKTELVLVMVVDQMTLPCPDNLPERSILYSCQSGNEGRSRLETKFVPTLKKSPLWDALGFKARMGMGLADLHCPDMGTRLGIMNSSDDSGHGPTLFLGLGDEAFAYKTNAIEGAFVGAMKTIPEAQMGFISTAGDVTSSLLKRYRDNGRRYVAEQMCYAKSLCHFEWSQDEQNEDLEIYDPDVIEAANPGIGYVTDMETILKDSGNISEEAHRRMVLNMFVEAMVEPALPPGAWKECLVDKVKIEGDVVIGLAVEGDSRDYASAVACSADGQANLEEVWRLSAGADSMLDWVVKAATKHKDVRGVAIGNPGPLAGFIDQLEAAGVNVLPYDTRKMRAACGWLLDQVAGEKLGIKKNRELSAAAAQAIRMPKNAKQGWTWGWADPSANLSSLWALTMACHAATYEEPEPEAEVGWSFA